MASSSTSSDSGKLLRARELKMQLAAQNEVLNDTLPDTTLFEIMGIRSETGSKYKHQKSSNQQSNSKIDNLRVLENISSSHQDLQSPTNTTEKKSEIEHGYRARKIEFPTPVQLLEYFWHWAHFAQQYQWAFLILAVISATILLFLCVFIWFWYFGILGFFIGAVGGITRKLSSAVITTISVPPAIVGGLYDSTISLGSGISNLSSKIYDTTSGAIFDAMNALLMSSLSCLLVNSSSCANKTNETFVAYVNHTAEIYTKNLLPPEAKDINVYYAFLGFAYTSTSTSSLLMHAAAGAKYQQPLGDKLHISYKYGSELFTLLSDALYGLVSSQASTYNVMSGEWLRVLGEVDAYDTWLIQASFYNRFFEKKNRRIELQLRYTDAINRTLFQVTRMMSVANECDTILRALSHDFMEQTSDNLAANEQALAVREQKLRSLNLGLSWWKFWKWGERKLQGEVLNNIRGHFVFLQQSMNVTREVIHGINHRLKKMKIALEDELQYAEKIQWSDFVTGNGTGSEMQLLRTMLIKLHMQTEEQYQLVREALKKPSDEYEGAKGREFHGIYPFF